MLKNITKNVACNVMEGGIYVITFQSIKPA